MTKNAKKWQEMTKNDKKWQKMAKNDKKWQKMTRNDKKWQEMTKNEKNDIFYIYYVILQYYKMINPSGDFCPILSRSQNIVPWFKVMSCLIETRPTPARHTFRMI